MAERWMARIRQVSPEDSAAMEWEGEHRCCRRLYRQAMTEVFTARCGLLLADAGGHVVGQVVVRFDAAPPQLDDASQMGSLHGVRVRPVFRSRGIVSWSRLDDEEIGARCASQRASRRESSRGATWL